MIIKVLGSAAGGGFPQWNCNGLHSANVRAGVAGYKAQTAIVSRRLCGRRELGVAQCLARHPPADQRNARAAAGQRSGGSAQFADQGRCRHQCRRRSHRRTDRPSRRPAVLDLRLRPRARDAQRQFDLQRLRARDRAAGLRSRSIRRLLSRAPGVDLGLTVEAFPVPGKVALFLEKGDADSNFGSRDGDTIGLKVTDAKTGKSFFYIPGCAEVDPPLADRIRGADLIFLRRHALHRRRDDQPGPLEQNRQAHGPYFGIRARRFDRGFGTSSASSAGFTSTSTIQIRSWTRTQKPVKSSRPPVGKSASTAWRSAYEPSQSREEERRAAGQASRRCRRPNSKPQIRAVGPERYHDLHPFHHMLHGGKLNKGQVQAWALNRYCYQSAVPRKDAALDQPRARPRTAPRVDASHSRSRRASARRAGRHRALARSDRRPRSRSRVR